MHFVEPEMAGYGRPRRITIVGTSGSGKTHLAARLAGVTGLCLIHLDVIKNTVTGISEEKFKNDVSNAINAEEWIIDGYYRSVGHIICRRAEIIIWLDYSRFFVIRRLLKRYIRKQARRIVTMAAGSELTASYDPAVGKNASWPDRMVRFSRALREKSEFETLLASSANANAKIVRIVSPRQVHDLLSGFAAATAVEGSSIGSR